MVGKQLCNLDASRRSILRSLGGIAVTASLAGCVGVFEEEERDVSLRQSNWAVPAEDGPAVASGFTELYEIYNEIKTIDDVTWADFIRWIGAQWPPVKEIPARPLVPHDVLAGGKPFVVGNEGGNWFHSRDIPAMATLTIRNAGGDGTRPLVVLQLPDSDSKQEYKEYMMNHGKQFKQVNGTSVTKPITTYNDNDQFARFIYALEDGLVLAVGGRGQTTGRGEEYYLQEALARTGDARQISGHPVADLQNPKMLRTYTQDFLRSDINGIRSKSVGINFEGSTKEEVLTFVDAAAAEEARTRFDVGEGGAVQAEREDGLYTWNWDGVEYLTIRQKGRGIFFEAEILNLAKTIRDGDQIWSAGLFGS